MLKIGGMHWGRSKLCELDDRRAAGQHVDQTCALAQLDNRADLAADPYRRDTT